MIIPHEKYILLLILLLLSVEVLLSNTQSNSLTLHKMAQIPTIEQIQAFVTQYTEQNEQKVLDEELTLLVIQELYEKWGISTIQLPPTLEKIDDNNQDKQVPVFGGYLFPYRTESVVEIASHFNTVLEETSVTENKKKEDYLLKRFQIFQCPTMTHLQYAFYNGSVSALTASSTTTTTTTSDPI